MKNKKLISTIAVISAAVLGLIAVLMIFATGMKDKIVGTSTFTYLEMTFGKKQGEMDMIKFSFMNLLPFILAIGAIVMSILNLLGKGGKFGGYIAAALFIVAAVFFFLAIQLTVIANAPDGYKLSDFFQLGAAPIVAGVFSILAAIASVVSPVMDKVAK